MSALVQASAIRVCTGDDTPTAISLNGVVSGNSVLVALFAVEFTSALPNCTVTDGTGYTLGHRTSYSAGASEKWVAEVHHLHNSAGGNLSIAVDSGGTAGNVFGQIMAFEVSGLANAMPDKVAGTGANSTTPSTGSTGTLTQAANFGLAIMGSLAGGIDAASESFTNSHLDNTGASDAFCSIDRKVISATTALNVNWGTLSSSNQWVSALAVYADAATGGGRLVGGSLVGGTLIGVLA